MPFHSGTTVRCSQGPNGDYSHRGFNTADALDFTSPRGTEVVAAAYGTAYVFADIPDPSFQPEDCQDATSRGFGNHVNVDHGNGLFTVYAHLETIAAGIDGQVVTQGQYIGTVDTTGFSCGDHLHFGLLQGDPTQPATASMSVPITRLFVRLGTGGAGGDTPPREI